MNGVIYYEKFLIIAIFTTHLYSQDINPDLIEWKRAFVLKQRFFFILREKLNEPEYHSKCVQLIHDRYDVLNAITQMKATAQEAMGFLHTILEDYNFDIPTRFEVSADSKLFDLYEKYFIKFAYKIEMKDVKAMIYVPSEARVTLTDADIVLFKDLLTAHIAILLKVPIPELKKESCCLL